MTPISRLAMANTISVVTAIFGMAARNRNMERKTLSGPNVGREARYRVEARLRPILLSRLEVRDLVPQCAKLGLVSGPDFLLRDPAEPIDLGFDHGHTLGLE